MMTGIYEILNTETGMWYRGQTQVDLTKRCREHRRILRAGSHGNKHLQSAWDYYGEEVFVFTVLEECPPEDCDARETWWIGEDYNRPDISYNKMGGGGSCGLASEETKRRQSEIRCKLMQDPAERQKISVTTSKAMQRPDVKQRTSEAQKKRFANPEERQKAREQKGKSYTVTWPDGRVDRYWSLNHGAEELGVSTTMIRSYLIAKNKPGARVRSKHLEGCTFSY